MPLVSATFQAEFSGKLGTGVGTSSTPQTEILGTSVSLAGGTSEPAILGKAFSKLFEDHTHPSPNGPTGPLSPKFAPKIKKSMARKVFLA